MIERQCEGWPAFYFVQGPFGLRIWNDHRAGKGNDDFLHDRRVGGPRAARHLDGRTAPSVEVRGAHARRLHDGPMGGQHARRLHDAHEGRLHPEDRTAEQRPSDDDDAVLSPWRRSDRAGGCRGSDLSGRTADHDEELPAVNTRNCRRSVRRACRRIKGACQATAFRTMFPSRIRSSMR